MGPYDVPVLDSFSRADENPVSQAGNWVGQAYVIDGVSKDLRVVSNQLAASDNNPHSAVYDLPVTDGVVFATIAATGLYYALYIRTAGEGGAASALSGYCLERNVNWAIRRKDAGGLVTLGAAFGSPAPAAGDAIALAAVGSVLQFWHRPVAGSWTLVTTREDETYDEGRLALEGLTNTLRFDDFGGGPIPPRTKVFIDGDWVDGVKRMKGPEGWDPPYLRPFSAMPVLDDFARANENPVSQGGNWVGRWSTSTNQDLKVVSGELVPNSAGAACSALYGDAVRDQAIYATIAELSATSVNVLLGVRLTQQVGAAIGYALWHDATGGGRYRLVRADGAGGTVDLATFTTGGLFTEGWKLGLRAVGDEISAWVDPGTGWIQFLFTRDDTYETGRRGLLLLTDGDGAFDDVGGWPTASS